MNLYELYLSIYISMQQRGSKLRLNYAFVLFVTRQSSNPYFENTESCPIKTKGHTSLWVNRKTKPRKNMCPTIDYKVHVRENCQELTLLNPCSP